MSTDINTPGRLVTSNYDPFFSGIYLKAGADHYNISEYVSDPSAAFQSGMIVKVTDSGLISVCDDGADVLGVAALSRTEALEGVEIDMPVTVSFGNTVSLDRNGPINPDHFVVRRVANGSSADEVAEAGNWTLNSNTITWNAAPADGALVDDGVAYVSFRFPLSTRDVDLQGVNLYGNADNITMFGDRVPVIRPRGGTRLYTTHFDVNRTYTYGGVGSALFAGNNSPNDLSGLFTNDDQLSTERVGSVAQPPRQDYPVLGVYLER